MLNKGILVTRPETLATPLIHALNAAGARVWYFPSLEIEFLNHEPAVLQAITACTDYSWQIFVSRHAVQAVLPQILQTWSMLDLKPLHWAAVGPGTAAELARFIKQEIVYPHTGLGSAALLAQLQPQIQAHDKLLVWCGDKPLGQWPQARLVTCYRCKKNALKSEEIECALMAGEINVVTITSGRSLEHLIDTFNIKQLNRCTLIVVSERLINLSRELGFTGEIILARGADDQSVIQAIKG